MDVTPKAKRKTGLSLKKSGSKRSPDHSTPEASTSRKAQVVYSAEQFIPTVRSVQSFSPIDSPSRYGLLSQDIHVCWGWKSPDGAAFKRTGQARGRAALKTDLTPQNTNSSPRPKRKLNHRNYSDKLRSLAKELKSFADGMQSSVLTGKSTEDDADSSAINICEPIRDEPIMPLPSKPSNSDAVGPNNSGALGNEQLITAPEEDCGDVQQDCLVVELTQGGLTSLKAFPPNHRFPQVPKLELDTNMNSTDYVILMGDSSIEDEMMRCSQQVEEEYVGRNGGKDAGPQEKDLNVKGARNKLADFMTLPKNESNSTPFPTSPVLNTKFPSIKRSSHSPKNRPNSKHLVNQAVSWDSTIGVACRERVGGEEDVMGMLADDSFDNIMLELVVQGEPSIPESHKDKENGCPSAVRRTGGHSLKLEGDSEAGDSMEMLEDDSLIHPEVLNFLDLVESQATAPSQSSKCTQEEIKWKMIEAKKKLAVRKREHRSRINGVSPKRNDALN